MSSQAKTDKWHWTHGVGSNLETDGNMEVITDWPFRTEKSFACQTRSLDILEVTHVANRHRHGELSAIVRGIIYLDKPFKSSSFKVCSHQFYNKTRSRSGCRNS